ncbi:MAG: hypothetical protein A3G41_03765 [Elusimicrobia bacterium RIFCSPLOWO2_12_FULL_59_9]|nr:MAG: hypothetical protein A3G41_03765 [Elusimicrobia bacterium RIFCSPLOWO2_12_FULL_59_9]
MELTILLPTLNEAGNVSSLIAEAKDVVSPIVPQFEILVIDGGSRDGTVEEARRAGARVRTVEGLSYGRSLREGFSQAEGRLILTLDADLSHPIRIFPLMWEAMRGSGAQMVIASRYVAGGRVERPFFRDLLSRTLNKISSSLLDIPLNDLSSGFRLYEKKALDSVTTRAVNFDIQEELITQFANRGYKIMEVPGAYGPRHEGMSKANVLLFAFSYLKTLSRMWWQRRTKI